jgi:hypothetical protein
MNLKRLFGRQPLPTGLLVIAKSSFFLVSTEMTEIPCPRHFFTLALMCRNCASRAG